MFLKFHGELGRFLLQDILDTGNTLQYMLKSLKSRDPASVRTVCFTHKVPAPHLTAPTPPPAIPLPAR